ncbi:glutathione S-transferase [Xylaria bambusicola]|uniref:glutathione S-transferase n=1 Tax=Xylaria bambusicola TaxID=326684 RepID=UPI002007B150|nr:glutathione S-transferase [Xylaria bambusicola]KAI0508733.1 glutathione S-transferase [Xylaria bambusicola]
MAPESKLFLHDHPISSYAQKVRIALRWKHIAFEHAIPRGMGSGQQEMKDFPTSLHPRQEVPALIDGDTRIFDSTIILEYLEDKFPEPALLPPRSDPAARARARMIEDLCDTHYEAINWGYAEVTRYERGVAEGVAEKLKTQAGIHTRDILAWLEAQLGAGPFFNGATFGWADCAVAPFLNRSVAIGLGPAEGSPLQQWHARISELPCVRETFAEYEAGTKALAAMVGNPFQSGSGAKREYRDHRVEWILKAGGISIIESGLRDRNIRFSWPGPDPPE